MKVIKVSRHANKDRQTGAALITVLFVSLLLLTACAAMLTAVGANSSNTTDVLSETKAYYAAESGIQATVNVLRNAVPSPSGTPYTYASFIANPSLSNWLTYSGSPSQVLVGTGTGTGYSINVTDPDGTSVPGNIIYQTAAKFTGPNAQIAGDGSMWIPSTPPATPDGTPRTRILIETVNSGSPTAPNTKVADFTVEDDSTYGGPDEFSGVTFRIDYILTAPRHGVASIYGTITKASGSPITVTFQSRDYRLLGSTMQLCTDQASGCPITPTTPLTLSGGINPTTPLYISSSTAFSPEPYRLKVVSNGYGPNGSKKTLEAIVRRNLFDGFDAPGTMSLIGPHNDGVNTFFYHPGNSNGTTYSGGDCATACIPSFAVADVNPAEAQLNLDYINTANAPLGTQPTPGSQRVDIAILPSWLQSPANLDVVIDQLRVTAQHSGRHFVGGTRTNPGDYATGTGITFCEGSCSVKGEGGGILVVTGQVTAVGGFNFKGLIIVTGRGGWARSGGGNGSILGAIIIAPYNRPPYSPENLSSTFLAPSYDMSGGGGSDVTNTETNPFIDNSLGVTDIVLGVAEK